MRANKVFTILLLSVLVVQIHAQPDSDRKADILPDAKRVNIELVNAGLKNPWGMAFLPNGDLLVTEKTGKIVRLSNWEIVDADVKGGPTSKTQGQGGLMDIQLHPNFEENGWVYFTYASSEGQGSGAMTALSQATWDGSKFTGHKVLYKGSPNTRAGQHFGSRIAFDAENNLYFSIGDRGQRDRNPQDITRDGGKIYRLTDEGEVPTDNPFVSQSGAIGAIYSYGHRNPQGMATHPETGEIWAHEHGPRGGDELNVIGKGKNYGWPIISYGINYSGSKFTSISAKAGMEQPATYWKPSIAPCGMTFVNSDKYPDWKNNAIVGSLKFSYLVRCEIQNDRVVRQEKIASGIGRVRSVIQGPDGYLYVGVEGRGIFRLTPN